MNKNPLVKDTFAMNFIESMFEGGFIYMTTLLGTENLSLITYTGL